MSSADQLNWATAGRDLLSFAKSPGGAMTALQLFGSIEQSKLIRDAARAQGRLERLSIERAARFDAEARSRQLNRFLGTQRAVLASNSVVGGATARAIDANTRFQFGIDQDAADFSTQAQMQASRFGELGGINQARMARAQAGVDLLSNVMQGMSRAGRAAATGGVV